MGKKMNYTGTERRAYLRIYYPYTERPKLIIDEKEVHVSEISEHGIRFYLGSKVNATITFHDGESLPIEGEIIRIHNNEAAVHIAKGIPYDRVIKEQEYLMKNK